jgi:opacity protein-like surface antigen
MRRTMIGMTFVTLLMTPVLAQNPPAQNEPGNRAINSRDQNNANNPVAGANSFTEGQAKSRIESNGYANVSNLRKDDQGVWRGKAQKDGKTMDVSLDFQGNVIGR